MQIHIPHRQKNHIQKCANRQHSSRQNIKQPNHTTTPHPKRRDLNQITSSSDITNPNTNIWRTDHSSPLEAISATTPVRGQRHKVKGAPDRHNRSASAPFPVPHAPLGAGENSILSLTPSAYRTSIKTPIARPPLPRVLISGLKWVHTTPSRLSGSELRSPTIFTLR